MPAEFYWVSTRRLEPPLPHDAARAATASLSALPVVSTDAAFALAAIDTAAAADIALWDAMIVVAARRAGCDEVLTEDLNYGQVIGGVRITNPLFPAERRRRGRSAVPCRAVVGSPRSMNHTSARSTPDRATAFRLLPMDSD